MRLIDADELKQRLPTFSSVIDEMPTIDAVFCTNCGALVNGGNEQMDRKVKGLRISFKEPKEVMASRAQALFYGAALYTEYFIKDGFLMIVDGETLIAMYALDEIFSVKLIFEGEPEFEGEVV